eukprot:10814263-Ditylum_brightwellii.AAC.1
MGRMTPVDSWVKTSYLQYFLLVRGSCKSAIDHWFAQLCMIEPPCGYIPEPSKSILVTSSDNIEQATAYFEHYNFKIKAGNCYLGGYLGEKELVQEYATKKVMEWVSSVNTFADMMDQQPQTAFAGFARLLQCKWAYLQQSMELAGDVFDLLEEAIHQRLLPALFDIPAIPDDL